MKSSCAMCHRPPCPGAGCSDGRRPGQTRRPTGSCLAILAAGAVRRCNMPGVRPAPGGFRDAHRHGDPLKMHGAGSGPVTDVRQPALRLPQRRAGVCARLRSEHLRQRPVTAGPRRAVFLLHHLGQNGPQRGAARRAGRPSFTRIPNPTSSTAAAAINGRIRTPPLAVCAGHATPPLAWPTAWPSTVWQGVSGRRCAGRGGTAGPRVPPADFGRRFPASSAA